MARFHVHDGRGLEVTVWRDPQLRAFQISCAADGAAPLFDDLIRAGKPLGLRLAGQQAFDVLQLEAGVLVPDVDFAPARSPFARDPSPQRLA